jgi:thioredoxin 1
MKILFYWLVIIFTLWFAGQTAAESSAPVSSEKPAEPGGESVSSLPKLVVFTSPRYKACAKIQPILVELKSQYKSQLVLETISVLKQPQLAYKIKLRKIPTLLFYDRQGKIFFRKEGYFSLEQIINKFRKNGFELKPRDE